MNSVITADIIGYSRLTVQEEDIVIRTINDTLEGIMKMLILIQLLLAHVLTLTS